MGFEETIQLPHWEPADELLNSFLSKAVILSPAFGF
jgi:hypothetical protein